MNEFIKLCHENGIDLEGAQALLSMAGGDGKKAVEFIKYMQGDESPSKAWRSEKVVKHGDVLHTNQSISGRIMPMSSASTCGAYGIGKHGIVKDQYSSSALYCGHANECPVECDCPGACHCRTHGNCGPK
jgi:hypothetical protein